MIESLDWASLSVGVLVVEARGDGNRRHVIDSLLRRGFVYVGQLYARPTVLNFIVDDVFVNVTHLRTHFPRSRALRVAAS